MAKPNVSVLRVMNIFMYADFAVSKIAEEFGEGRNGGYLCIANQKTGTPIAILRMGTPAVEKEKKSLFLSQEKSKRLSENPTHVLSWQSRDPENGKFGGSVLAREAILSFSGFPEKVDEAFMLVLAIKTGQMSLKTAVGMADISDNRENLQKILHLLR